MRKPFLLGAAAAALLTACSSGVRVSTTVAPDASLSGLHTFYVLNVPNRAPEAPTLSNDDPMLQNSLTNQQLKQDLAQAFETRGYTATTRSAADFLVAYYVGTKDKFNTAYWGPAYDPDWRYTYRGNRMWAWPWYVVPPTANVQLTEYMQGQVVVDVIDPRTRELIWRGQGAAEVSKNPKKYASEIDGAVNAVLKKFPQGAPGSVAGAQ